MALDAGISDPIFVEQSSRGFSDVLGHGDALFQVHELLVKQGKLGDADYYVTNFGGDVNNPHTISASLSAMGKIEEMFDFEGSKEFKPWGIIPSAEMIYPPYPVNINDDGTMAFGHQKLFGTGVQERGGSNIGVRIYNAGMIGKVLTSFYDSYYTDKGYSMPRNANKNEFSLDNLDMALSEITGAEGRRISNRIRMSGLMPSGEIEYWMCGRLGVLKGIAAPFEISAAFKDLKGFKNYLHALSSLAYMFRLLGFQP
jgi:hypothetical protein